MREEERPLIPSREQYLATMNLVRLRRLLKFWLKKGEHKVDKATCIEMISKNLANKKLLEEFIGTLSDADQAALGLIKLRSSQTIELMEYIGEVVMLGYEESKDAEHTGCEILNKLKDKGLIHRLDLTGGDINDYHSHVRSSKFFADPAILAAINPLPPKVLAIKPVTTSVTQLTSRSSTEVMLEQLALAQAIKKIGGLSISRKDILSKADLKRLAKELNSTKKLSKEALELEVVRLNFLCGLWQEADLLVFNPAQMQLQLANDLLAVLAQPPLQLAQMWLRCYRSLISWQEYNRWDENITESSHYNGLRAIILMALAALPQPNAWYQFSDFNEAIFSRVTGRYTFSSSGGWIYMSRSNRERTPDNLRRWRAMWQTNEAKVVEGAISFALFSLGFVELATTEETAASPNLFRLTPSGQAAIGSMYGNTSVATELASDNSGIPRPCWIVQPNFDLVVYPQAANLTQLSFIERIALRKQVDSASAVYQITRESIYQALESGLTASELLTTLSNYSLHPLPEGVNHTLLDWAKRRERLTVYLSSSLLEFPDKATRDAALAGQASLGTAVGDCFIIVNKLPKALKTKAAINYWPSPPQCLLADETGRLTIKTTPDLLIADELASFSQQISNKVWQITSETVAKALANGLTTEVILERLTDRATQGFVPKFLLATIKAWAGKAQKKSTTLALPQVTLLQVLDPLLAEAITLSQVLKPYIQEKLNNNYFLIAAENLTPLIEKLRAHGFEISRDLIVINTARS